MKRIFAAIALAGALFAPVGCHNTNMAPTPPLINSVNAFDSTSYRSLITLQASLNSLKASIAADSTNLGSLKPTLNQAIADFNVAQTAWKIYHATQSNQQDVTDTLNKTQGDISNLQSKVGK